ncbi:MAG: hypothetical protein JO142_02085, partial [Burkholderiales bacterium]|nr:hypothetical protein [Burkholderiales bacterium]
MNLLFFDTETYCETPITYGTHRYAEDAEIIMWQWAIDDGPVQISETLTPELRELLEFIARQPADYTDAQLDALFSRPRTRIVTHNSAFDRTVLRHAAKLDIPVENWHDTMVQAMAHGLPGGLGILCEIFKISVDKAKDKAGKDLIQLFCKPRPQNSKLRRATKATHPEKWAQFLGYGGLDVEAMREIYRKLPKWNYNPDGTPGSAGKREFDMWCLDQRINDRGVCVD